MVLPWLKPRSFTTKRIMRKQDNLIKDDVMVRSAGCAGDDDGGACCSEELRRADVEPSDAVMEPEESMPLSTSPSFPSFEMELRDAIVKLLSETICSCNASFVTNGKDSPKCS